MKPIYLMTILITALLVACVPALSAPTIAQATAIPPSNIQLLISTPSVQSPTSSCAGYMNFVVNTHDWSRVNESADTILRFIALYEKYGVRGEFYLTAPMVEAYVQQRPDVIERLKNSAMTISYHIRPPHPAYVGFDETLKRMDDKTLEQTLRDYETYRLDLATGKLDKTQPGGYAYVAQVFGRKPVAVSPQAGDPRGRKMMTKIYAAMGAQMQVQYHEEGTALDKPLVKVDGLWVRPSDFSITRIPITTTQGTEQFWWNAIGTPRQNEFKPATMLKEQLAKWNAPRAPFITSLIHENDVYSSGGPGWTNYYYAQGKPLQPPYNLAAPDTSKPRSQKSQDAIWQAYEEMVAYAAQNLCVVTSQDLVRLANGIK